ncbi:hypothetical protein F1C58_16640 (plasmid) [Glaciihabitans sp. INWT7]|uniref:hypothetical protein n=1 Tax=Glaciihabitans sp. INWT7 TaxID=2596912 RepID=UPI0016271B8A|nr:hypothetical protein [Glaciihabitans sp. INWT7]QNE48685.1 hypothetical protein F1C58_16640 [Glaciihabitans sp. INWT7]
MATAVETNQTTTITPSPIREDGASWPYALLVADETIYADSLTELVAHVIEGYDAFADDEEGDVLAFLTRVDSASSIAAQSQAVVLAEMTESGEFDPETSTETILTALLTPRGTGLVDGSDFGGNWDNPVPLLLLTTDYAPFTAYTLITGNVEYFDPSNERTYLESLQKFGFVELFVNADI